MNLSALIGTLQQAANPRSSGNSTQGGHPGQNGVIGGLFSALLADGKAGGQAGARTNALLPQVAGQAGPPAPVAISTPAVMAGTDIEAVEVSEGDVQPEALATSVLAPMPPASSNIAPTITTPETLSGSDARPASGGHALPSAAAPAPMIGDTAAADGSEDHPVTAGRSNGAGYEVAAPKGQGSPAKPLDGALVEPSNPPPSRDSARPMDLPIMEAAALKTAGESSGGARTAPATQIAQQAVHVLRGETDVIRFVLHPAELGRVSIQMRVRDGSNRLVISVERPAAIEALKHSSPALHQALADAGFDLQADDLRFSVSDDRDGRGAQHRNPHDREFAGREQRESGSTVVVVESEPAPSNDLFL